MGLEDSSQKYEYGEETPLNFWDWQINDVDF